MNFYGYDYTELAERWNFYIPDEEITEMYDFEYFGEMIKYCWRDYIEDTRFVKRMCKDIREYCIAMAKLEHNYDAPMWEGMAKIKDDYSLLRLFIPLLGYAWT